MATSILSTATLRPILIRPAERILVEPLEAIPVWPVEPLLVTPTIATLVLPIQPLLVEPPPRPLWDERGWTRREDHDGSTYEGEYLARAPRGGEIRRFGGRIEQRGRKVSALVADPPPGLRRHPKAACFHIVGAGPWFAVNWFRPASSADEAINYIEQVLTEALAR
jgi:hypothetical protein